MFISKNNFLYSNIFFFLFIWVLIIVRQICQISEIFHQIYKLMLTFCSYVMSIQDMNHLKSFIFPLLSVNCSDFLEKNKFVFFPVDFSADLNSEQFFSQTNCCVRLEIVTVLGHYFVTWLVFLMMLTCFFEEGYFCIERRIIFIL